MKRVIESAIWAALVCSLAACERDAISAGRQSATLQKGHDASAPTGWGQVWELTDGGPREIAPVAPLQVPTGSGGTGGSGGTFGSGGSGGTSTGGSGGTSTGGSGGLGGIGGMNTGGTLRGER